VEMIVTLAAGALPLTLLVAIGSFWSIKKSAITKKTEEGNKTIIPLTVVDYLGILLVLWVVTLFLQILCRVFLSGPLAYYPGVADLWAPLLGGVLIGRPLVSWRKQRYLKTHEQKHAESE